MARIPRRQFPQGVYHVTGRGVARSDIYLDGADHRLFLVLLGSAVERWGWTFYVLCLMPNHYHFIVETTGPRLSAGMHRVNGIYASAFNAKYERSGHLFGDRFFTRMIESEKQLDTACRYVLDNPVRAGLCATPAEWRWSWSRYGYDTS